MYESIFFKLMPKYAYNESEGYWKPAPGPAPVAKPPRARSKKFKGVNFGTTTPRAPLGDAKLNEQSLFGEGVAKVKGMWRQHKLNNQPLGSLLPPPPPVAPMPSMSGGAGAVLNNTAIAGAGADAAAMAKAKEVAAMQEWYKNLKSSTPPAAVEKTFAQNYPWIAKHKVGLGGSALLGAVLLHGMNKRKQESRGRHMGQLAAAY